MKKASDLNQSGKFLNRKIILIFFFISSITFAQGDFPWVGNETDPCISPATTWYLGGNNLQAPNPGPQILGSPPPSYTVQNDVGTCNNYDFILKSNNNQLVFLTTTKRVGIGNNNTMPHALLDVFDVSNSNVFHTLIKGDQNGTIEVGNDMNLNFANHSVFNVNEGSNNRLKINNGTTQNFGNFIVGGSSYSPSITAMTMIDGRNNNGIKIDADNGKDAIQVYNGVGAGRLRVWVNSGGVSEDTKLHFSGSAQFGFITNTGLLDNGARLNVEAYSWSNMNGLKVSVNSPTSYSNNTSTNKAIFVQNSQGTSTAQIAFEVLSNGATHIGFSRPAVSNTAVCSSAMLTVDGQILARDIRVSNTNGSHWADYVFDKNYRPMSLIEIEKYIIVNKHLPEIQSEADVKKDGVDLLELNIALLKKIEELYLYTIDLKKENAAQNEKIKKIMQLIKN